MLTALSTALACLWDESGDGYLGYIEGYTHYDDPFVDVDLADLEFVRLVHLGGTLLAEGVGRFAQTYPMSLDSVRRSTVPFHGKTKLAGAAPARMKPRYWRSSERCWRCAAWPTRSWMEEPLVAVLREFFGGSSERVNRLA